MRKFLLVTMLLIVLMSISGFTAVFAQTEDDPETIEYGDTVDGEISNDDYEFYYTFEGSEGDVVIIEMFAEPGTYGVDPRLELLDDDGDLLVENDDLYSLNSVIITTLRSDGDYTIVASRFGGEDGGSEGNFLLRLNQTEFLQPGDTYETTIFNTFDTEESAMPQFAPMMFEDDTTLQLTFSQEISELFPSIRMVVYDESFGGYLTVFEVNNTSLLSNATFTVELEAERLYVLWATTSFSSFSFDVEEAEVTIEVEEG